MRMLRTALALLALLAPISALAQAPNLSLNLGQGPNDRTGASVRDLFRAVQDNLNAVNAQVQSLGAVQKGPRVFLGGDAPALPTLTDLSYQIYARRYANGTTTNGVNLSLINVEHDTATVQGPNFLNVFAVQDTFGGPDVQGGRQGIQSLLIQTAATNAVNANRNYVGGTFITQTASGDAGTGLTYDPTGVSNNTAKGGYFGINPVCILQAGATNVLNCSAGELNIAAQSGSSVAYKSGIQISALGSDAVKGSVVDAMISLSNQLGAVGFHDGILFANQNGTHPIDADGYLLRSYGPGRATVGISAAGVITTSNLAGSGTRPIYAAADGTLQTAGPTAAPAAATSACQAGATTYDTGYFYVCIAANTWRRAPVAVW